MPISKKLTHSFLLFVRVFLVTIGLLSSSKLFAQTNPFDEVSVFFNIQNIDNTEFTALIKDETALLPVKAIFDFIKIKNVQSTTRDTLSGFFINEKATYLMDTRKSTITYDDKDYELPPGSLINYNGELFLASEYFGKIFALSCNFNFRNLSVTLTTQLELPVIREKRLSQTRTTSMALNVSAKADTIVGRTYPLFHFGMADWSVTNTIATVLGSSTRANVALGGVIAGGETNVALSYSTFNHFDRSNQFYSWRLVNNDNPAIRQIVAGKVFTQTIASIFSPILGITVTNTPTTFRRAYGTYTLTNTTYPNWIVELYVNGVLIGFQRTDAAGLYSFQVPLVYGASQIKLRFYGPSGEERYTEQNINIPYNFLPKHKLEYIATAGVVDGTSDRFSRVSAAYGVNNKLTVGAGTEYLSSLDKNNVIPFVNASARVFKNILLSGEYAHNVRSRAVVSYNLYSGFQFEFSDTWYKQGQTAIINAFVEERRAILTVPIRTKSFAAFTRATVNQIRLPYSDYTTAEWLVSASRGRYIFSVNTYGVLIKGASPVINSNIALTTTLFKRYLFTQQAQYDYSQGKVISFKSQVERPVFKSGYANLSVENSFYTNLPTVELGLRYEFRFMQAGFISRANKSLTSVTQTANGSIINDPNTNYRGFRNYTNVGKGGVTVIPFLDLNYNGHRDVNEPKVYGVKLRVIGGRTQLDQRDTLIRITDLEPYNNYLIEIDPFSLENITWRLKRKDFSVAIDPNQIKVVEIPIQVASEASGKVSFKDVNDKRGLGRLNVEFYDALSSKLITRTTTEQDGYFTYLGLQPGDYYVQLDQDQLRSLNIVSDPRTLKFKVKRTMEGDIIDGLNFVIQEISSAPRK